MAGPYKPVGVDADSLFPPRVETRLAAALDPQTAALVTDPATETAIALSATFGGEPGTTTRVTKSTLPNWRKAVARVRAGGGDAKLLCIGDSTVYGEMPISWPTRLAEFIDSTSTPSARGLTVPPLATKLAADTRWTAGTGWPDARGQGFGMQAWRATAPAGALVFADPTVSADRFDVYYLNSNLSGGFGTLTLTATGGTPVVQACNLSDAPALGVRKVTVSAAALAATNTLTITATGSMVYIVGVEPWNSTKSTVRVGNAGVPTTDTATWSSTGEFGSLSSITAYAADLTIIALGINDALVSRTPAAYLTNILNIAAAATGDVILLTPFPSQGAHVSFEDQYRAIVISDTTYPVVDLFEYVGSWVEYNALGFQLDGNHPNGPGYADAAGFINGALSRAVV